MKNEPDGIAQADLVTALKHGWGVDVISLEYLPLGAGSYHWNAVISNGSEVFVTVDDLGKDANERNISHDTLTAAFDTAYTLHHDAHLKFVVCPLPTISKTTLWMIGSRYAVSLYKKLKKSPRESQFHSEPIEKGLAVMLASLHSSTPLTTKIAKRTSLTITRRTELEFALSQTQEEWRKGPYAELVRRLLARNASRIERLLEFHDRLAAQVRQTERRWVITHGEPHDGNIVRSPEGLYLVDWDTVKIAPAERDLWMAAGGSEKLTGYYTTLTGHQVDPACIKFYEVHWKLLNIAKYASQLYLEHSATDDTRDSWGYLQNHLKG